MWRMRQDLVQGRRLECNGVIAEQHLRDVVIARVGRLPASFLSHRRQEREMAAMMVDKSRVVRRPLDRVQGDALQSATLCREYRWSPPVKSLWTAWKTSSVKLRVAGLHWVVSGQRKTAVEVLARNALRALGQAPTGLMSPLMTRMPKAMRASALDQLLLAVYPLEGCAALQRRQSCICRAPHMWE